MNKLIVAVFALMALASAMPSLVSSNGKLESSTKSTQKNVMDNAEPVSVSTAPGEAHLKANDQGHFIADFKMNGRTVTALVDTGASMVAINKSTARKLGINVSPSDFKYEVNTANGKTKVAGVIIREITIGRVKVRDVEAAVMDDKALDGTLLGMTFLKQLRSFGVTDGELVLKQ